MKVAFMRRTGASRAELRYAAQKATDAYPGDEAIWAERLKLELDGPDSETKAIFNTAVGAVSWSPSIWELCCDWIEGWSEGGESSVQSALEAYEVCPAAAGYPRNGVANDHI
jgi:hypothetical protein